MRCRRHFERTDGVLPHVRAMHQMTPEHVHEEIVLPADQSLDVLFHDFMADDIATVERIHAVAYHPMTESARSQLAAYMDANPRGKYGRIRYDLRRDFGIDPQVLRKRIDFYFERFPIRPENH